MARQQYAWCYMRDRLRDDYIRTLTSYHLAMSAPPEKQASRWSAELSEASATARRALVEHELEHGCGFRYSRAQYERVSRDN
jgi:hypothetical protein